MMEAVSNVACLSMLPGRSRCIQSSRPGRVGVAGMVVVLLIASVFARPCPAQVDTKLRFKLLPAFPVSVNSDPSLIGLQPFTLADVNGDAILDLIVIDQVNDTVDVSIGAGDGTFTFVRAYQAPADLPTAVAVADVSSPFASATAGRPDGNPDIIVGSDLGDVWILLGNGDGTFAPHEQDLTDLDTFNAGSIVGLALGDFDHSGTIDIAVGDDTDSVYFLCNDQGTFTSCATDMLDTSGDGMIEIVAGDFNGDGKLDVATLNRDSGNVSPMYGNGDGTFNEVSNTVSAQGEGDFPSAFVVAKIDSDTTDDLVVANYGTFGELFGVTLRGRPNSSFSTGKFVMEFMTTALAVADFDGDGAMDVLAATQDGARLTINLGDGLGGFADPFNPPRTANLTPGALMIAAADVGGDALPDFVVLQRDGMSMRVGINHTNDTPTPTSTATPTVTPTPSPTPVQIVDDDGCAIVAAPTNRAAWILLLPVAALLGRRRYRRRLFRVF